MDTKEFEARHALHFSPINVDGSVCVVLLSPPVVYNQLFGLLGVECKVVVGTLRC